MILLLFSILQMHKAVTLGLVFTLTKELQHTDEFEDDILNASLVPRQATESWEGSGNEAT